MKGPSPSLPPPSPSSTDVNGSDIPSLDAFGELTLESTIETVSHSMYPDPDSLESPKPIQNVDNLDNDCGDDYSTKLSDVFIDFGGDFGDDFHSTTGEVDNPNAIIENTVCYA